MSVSIEFRIWLNIRVAGRKDWVSPSAVSTESNVFWQLKESVTEEPMLAYGKWMNDIKQIGDFFHKVREDKWLLS